MDRVLIVDGSNLLFQMFFGMPARIVNSQGRAIQGTLGFTGALLKIIGQVRPSHILVVFDGEHGNSRRETDGEYKANRPDYSAAGEEENPFSQLPDICRALEYLNIRYVETRDCEADDLIASYALSLREEAQVVISSFDSDFFQLIDERVSVLRYRGERTVLCSPQYVMDRYGVPPGQYAYLKALTGDPADNIRGAEGIGVKTAARLLGRFGSLESILEGAEGIERPSVRRSVLENGDRIRRNYALIKLEQTQSLPLAKGELVFSGPGATTTEVLRGIGLR